MRNTILFTRANVREILVENICRRAFLNLREFDGQGPKKVLTLCLHPPSLLQYRIRFWSFLLFNDGGRI